MASEKNITINDYNGIRDSIDTGKKTKGVGDVEIEAASGISRTAFTRWKKGETSPKLESFIAVLGSVGLKLVAVPDDRDKVTK